MFLYMCHPIQLIEQQYIELEYTYVRICNICIKAMYTYVLFTITFTMLNNY